MLYIFYPLDGAVEYIDSEAFCKANREGDYVVKTYSEEEEQMFNQSPFLSSSDSIDFGRGIWRCYESFDEGFKCTAMTIPLKNGEEIEIEM